MANLVNERSASGSYSGLDVFGGSSYERELKLCQELGADVQKLKSLNFNTLQLAEIRNLRSKAPTVGTKELLHIRVAQVVRLTDGPPVVIGDE